MKTAETITAWAPPLTLHNAGHQSVDSRDYVHDVAALDKGPHRILIKYSIRGEGTIYVHDQRYRVPAGHLFMIERPGPYRYCYEGNGEPWQYSFICLHYASEQTLLPHQLRMSPVIDVRARPEIRSGIHALVEAYIQGRQTGLRESLAGYDVYAKCIEAGLHYGESLSKAGELHAWLQKHFREDVSLMHKSQELGMTQEALSRSFKQEFGLAPSQFLNGLRLRRARRLLEAGRLSLQEIAGDCGFNSANYFGRVFKAAMGQSPAQYRKNPEILGSES